MTVVGKQVGAGQTNEMGNKTEACTREIMIKQFLICVAWPRKFFSVADFSDFYQRGIFDRIHDFYHQKMVFRSYLGKFQYFKIYRLYF